MACAVDPSVVEYEYGLVKPLTRCSHCDFRGEVKATMDHVAKVHPEHKAPFMCKCGCGFGRKEKAKTHVTQKHKGEEFANLISQDMAVLMHYRRQHLADLSDPEGLQYMHDKLAKKLVKDTARGLKIVKSATSSPDVTSPPVLLSPIATPTVALHPPAEDPLLQTPSRVDEEETTPMEAQTATESVNAQQPSMMDLFNLLKSVSDGQTALAKQVTELGATQRDMLKRIKSIEDRQARQASRTQVEALEKLTETSVKEVQGAAAICSSAQGESRKVNNMLAELRGDIRTVSRSSEQFVDAAAILADARDSIKASSSSAGLGEILRVKETVKRIDDNVRHLSTAVTTTSNRSRSVLREVMHGFQRGLDAYENRHGAHTSSRSDEGRTEREEAARRSLNL